jgi:hypothetical protein
MTEEQVEPHSGSVRRKKEKEIKTEELVLMTLYGREK